MATGATSDRHTFIAVISRHFSTSVSNKYIRESYLSSAQDYPFCLICMCTHTHTYIVTTTHLLELSHQHSRALVIKAHGCWAVVHTLFMCVRMRLCVCVCVCVHINGLRSLKTGAYRGRLNM